MTYPQFRNSSSVVYYNWILTITYEALAFKSIYPQVKHILGILRCLLLLFQMDQLLGNMIEMWVDRMDNITQPERRKLSALALLSLLPSDNRWGNVFLKFVSFKHQNVNTIFGHQYGCVLLGSGTFFYMDVNFVSWWWRGKCWSRSRKHLVR